MSSWGKSNYEFLTVAVVCLILTSIVLGIVLNNVQNEKFRVFRYNAKTVGINAINYEARNSDSIVYLYELVNDNLVSEVKNNFSGDEVCDYYQSKVEFVGTIIAVFSFSIFPIFNLIFISLFLILNTYSFLGQLAIIITSIPTISVIAKIICGISILKRSKTSLTVTIVPR